MDGNEGVKLLQKVCVVLYMKRATYRMALNELLMALDTPEAYADLWGVLDAWGRVVTGRTDADLDVARPAPILNLRWSEANTPERRRMRTAEALAKRQGAVTSRDLANTLGLSQESARLILAQMVDAGRLQRHGDKKAARYVLPGWNGGTEPKAVEGYAAAE